VFIFSAKYIYNRGKFTEKNRNNLSGIMRTSMLKLFASLHPHWCGISFL